MRWRNLLNTNRKCVGSFIILQKYHINSKWLKTKFCISWQQAQQIIKKPYFCKPSLCNQIPLIWETIFNVVGEPLGLCRCFDSGVLEHGLWFAFCDFYLLFEVGESYPSAFQEIQTLWQVSCRTTVKIEKFCDLELLWHMFPLWNFSYEVLVCRNLLAKV